MNTYTELAQINDDISILTNQIAEHWLNLLKGEEAKKQLPELQRQLDELESKRNQLIGG